MANISIDKEYSFRINKFCYGDVPDKIMKEIGRFGPVASTLLEHHLPVWFPDLTRENGVGYDHVHKDGTLYELKCFTKGGACWAQSNMIGKGRKINKEKMHENAREKIYAFVNITDFPNVKVLFKTGIKLINAFPKGNISKTRWQKLVNA